MRYEPLLQHHDDPDHDAIVSGMSALMFPDDLVNIAFLEIPPISEISLAVIRQFSQSGMFGQPDTKRPAKSMFVDML